MEPAVCPVAGRPLRRDAERNRQRILRAAEEVFATRGFSASLDEIARHAEVGVGTVYRRFPEKQLLIDALFEERFGVFVELFEDALAQGDAWDALAGVLTRMVELQVEDRGLMELMHDDAFSGRRIAAGRERIAPLATELLRRAQAQGSARADLEPSDLPLAQMMVLQFATATADAQPELWRRMLAVVLDGLRAPAQTAATPLPAPALPIERLDEAMRCALSEERVAASGARSTAGP